MGRAMPLPALRALVACIGKTNFQDKEVLCVRHVVGDDLLKQRDWSELDTGRMWSYKKQYFPL